MANATIRVKPISAGAIKRAGIHNNRLYSELGYTTPENIIIGQTGLNKNYVLIDGIETNMSLKDTIYYRMKEAGDRRGKIRLWQWNMSYPHHQIFSGISPLNTFCKRCKIPRKETRQRKHCSHCRTLR